MLISKAKEIFEMKIRIAGGLSMPSDDDLSEIFYEALIYIATKCVPRELLRGGTKADIDEEVFRLIKSGYFIIKPRKPLFDDTNTNYSALEHLQIDSDLDYAVVNKAAALFSREMANISKFEAEAERIINRYKSNYNKVGA